LSEAGYFSCLPLGCSFLRSPPWGRRRPRRRNRLKTASLDANTHLAGWWKFDDASGTTAADASKQGRNGTLQGCLSFDKDSAPGRTGKALKFDGAIAKFVR